MKNILISLFIFFVISCNQSPKEIKSEKCFDSLSPGAEYFSMKEIGFIDPLDSSYDMFNFIPIKRMDLNNYLMNFYQGNIDTGFQIRGMRLTLEEINHIALAMDTIYNSLDTSDFIEILPVFIEYKILSPKHNGIVSYTKCINGENLMFNIKFLEDYEIIKVVPLKNYKYIPLKDTTIIRM
jgi:hypothetical protein